MPHKCYIKYFKQSVTLSVIDGKMSLLTRTIDEYLLEYHKGYHVDCHTSGYMINIIRLCSPANSDDDDEITLYPTSNLRRWSIFYRRKGDDDFQRTGCGIDGLFSIISNIINEYFMNGVAIEWTKRDRI